MNIVALYARVSTGNQEKEETVQSQLSEIKDHITKDGVLLGDNLSFIDDGWTGSILARPELDRLRDAVKSKLFQVLYVYDLGRLSRDFLNQLILKKEFEEAGIKIISLHDINNVNPESGFAQNMMGLFHDYERIKIAERFRRGKLYKAKNGLLFGWCAPYGYRYVKGDKKDIKGAHEINPLEAENIKFIFKWFVEEQLTIRQVIVRLYERKILPRKSKNGYWSTSTLSRLLRDESYIGTTYYNKRIAVEPTNPVNKDAYKKVKKSSRKSRSKDEWLPITIPALIDKNMFLEAQKQLKRNSQFGKRNKVNEYLLSTLIRCTCGSTRCGCGVKDHLYYRCTDREKRFPLPKQCTSPSVNSSVLDEHVWVAVRKLLTEPKQIENQYESFKIKVSSYQKNTNFVDIESLKKELDEQKDLEERFVKAYGAKVISLEQLDAQLADIKLKKGQIMSKLTTSGNSTSPLQQTIVLPDLKQFSDTMQAEIKDLDFKERQYAIRQLVDSVVTDGITATIEGSIPLTILEDYTHNNYEQEFINRYRRVAERRQINPIQRTLEKTSGPRRKLSICHDRAQCRRRRSPR